jgi:hypothetical protein
MECDYCKKTFGSNSSLTKHKKTNKACRRIQEEAGVITENNFVCPSCEKNFTAKLSLSYHISICKKNNTNLEQKVIALLYEVKQKTEHIKRLEEIIDKTPKITKIHKNTNIELQNELNQNYSKKQKSTRQKVELDPSKKLNSDNSDNSDITEYTFDTFSVPIRSDGMINATALCTAGNKLIGHYLENKQTKAYIKVLESNIGIPILELIHVKTGGNHSGTWVHRKIGYHLAQWISPQFAFKVSTILDELFVSGSVVIGKEKTTQHIELMYQEKLKSLQDKLVTTEQALEITKQEHTTLIAKHNSTLKNHRYVKFKEKGPCFYIIESGISSLDGIERKKFGIAGTTEHDTIDDRLKSHRTLWPQLNVNYIIFMKDIDVLENSIKRLYKKEINPNGHEIIEGVSTEQLIESIDKIIIALGIEEYHVLSHEKINEYNEYVQTTYKTFLVKLT